MTKVLNNCSTKKFSACCVGQLGSPLNCFCKEGNFVTVLWMTAAGLWELNSENGMEKLLFSTQTTFSTPTSKAVTL